jgi:hypothetical protein
VVRLVQEAAGEELRPPSGGTTLDVRVEADRRPFDIAGWEPLTRGAWCRDGMVVLRNAVSSGFDLLLRLDGNRACFSFRWRPPAPEAIASLMLRSRFHLLTRAVLLQYPAMWWAGRRGLAPIHAPACAVGSATALLAGPGGVGKSTLVSRVLAEGGLATGDNLAVTDGVAVLGVVEPLRLEGGTGRRMPHGRREVPLHDHRSALVPDRVLVLRRGSGDAPQVRSCSPVLAARSLTTGTYMAGELRRYWAFAATLAAGTGIGPAHPAVETVASAFAERLPATEIAMPRIPTPDIADFICNLKELQCE